MQNRPGARGFSLLEVLVALGIFAILVSLSAFSVQRIAHNRREAEAARELRQEAEACFMRITADLEGMPTRNDLGYLFGAPAVYPSGLEVNCAFISEQPAASTTAPAAAPMRGFSIVAYRVGDDAADPSRWGGLQRGLAGFTLGEHFMGLRKPASIDLPAPVQGADELPALPSLTGTGVRDWPAPSLLDWPLEPAQFAELSPAVISVGMAFQLKRGTVLPDGQEFPAGQILAQAPVRERPAGSGGYQVAGDQIGAVIIGLALLPERIRARLTLQELNNLRDALTYNTSPGGSTTGPALTETPCQYWERRAGPHAEFPLPAIPENIRRGLTFQQRLVVVGSAY